MDQLTPEELASLAADDRGPVCRDVVIAFTVMSFVSVCLRLFVRVRYQRTGWEDWTIVLSTIASIGIAVCQVLQVGAGSGKHAVLVPYPEGLSNIMKYLFYSIIAYNISLTITKISILLQYHRIFTIHKMRIPVYAALAMTSVWGLTLLFTSIFSCIPVEAFWEVTEQGNAKCVDIMALWYTNASVNIVTDILVAAIPIPGIWGLHIPKRQKIALLGILTIGWFICIVSVLRLWNVSVLGQHRDDITYYSAPTAYWSAIEANLAIVCASLPALKPLVVSIVPVFGTRKSSGQGSNAASGNNHRLRKLMSRDTLKHSGDKEQLTGVSSASCGHSFASSPSESGQSRKNIYVTKHFEQHVEDIKGPGNCDSQKEVTAAEILARGDV
ncbi:uncharacterized protein EKO05_0008579 [Ascochyta rabiei]|uniref:Uncharacterized protein n=1 Tax=Didymella rabiei TaxID=5454 RepID=A0A163G1X3_DIDRA|nr:uncharacterized protein EKO05_0008579 [Ascochyta rabiei]KZM24640.1 hypothetical protein ST47_g4344 [Ascochyta rabiei]UPX18275.1 hypothetical protein EKO05_0008579 [Ascochyta rabiei]